MKDLQRQLMIQLVRANLNTLSYFSKNKAGSKALEIFSTPRRGRYKGLLKELKESEEFYVTWNGYKMRGYHWPGGDHKVLLAHGWESNSGRWAPWIEPLKSIGFEILALDAPAHGLSESPYFTAIYYAEALEEALKTFDADVIIGHSAGGMAAAYLLAELEVSGPKELVLLGTPSELMDFLNGYQKTVGFNDKVRKALIDEIVKRFDRHPNEFSIKDFLKKLDIAGLIVHDKKDLVAPYEQALAMHENWEQSNLLPTEGKGHSLRGNEVIEGVIDYLRDL